MQRLRGFRGPRIYIAKLVSGMTSKDWGKMVNNAGGVISDMLDVLAPLLFILCDIEDLVILPNSST